MTFRSAAGSVLEFLTGNGRIRLTDYLLTDAPSSSSGEQDYLLFFSVSSPTSTSGNMSARQVQIRSGKKPSNTTSNGRIDFVPPFPDGWNGNNISVITTAQSGANNNEIRVVNTYDITRSSFWFMGNLKDGRSGQSGGGLYSGAFDWIAVGRSPAYTTQP
jgi:hypothetical protein